MAVSYTHLLRQPPLQPHAHRQFRGNYDLMARLFHLEDLQRLGGGNVGVVSFRLFHPLAVDVDPVVKRDIVQPVPFVIGDVV